MTDSQQLRDRIGQVDGGELAHLPRTYPYSVLFPARQSRAFIYTTKTHALNGLLASASLADDFSFGMIARYGLPHDDVVPAIANIVGDNAIYFLGDCDPYDLLVYAWLRDHLSIRFLGTSDAVVFALGVVVSEPITIPLPDEEQRAMSLVREVWPDFARSVGSDCARLLDGNRKLELEALVSFHTSPVGNLLNLLKDD